MGGANETIGRLVRLKPVISLLWWINDPVRRAYLEPSTQEKNWIFLPILKWNIWFKAKRSMLSACIVLCFVLREVSWKTALDRNEMHCRLNLTSEGAEWIHSVPRKPSESGTDATFRIFFFSLSRWKLVYRTLKKKQLISCWHCGQQLNRVALLPSVAVAKTQGYLLHQNGGQHYAGSDSSKPDRCTHLLSASGTGQGEKNPKSGSHSVSSCWITCRTAETWLNNEIRLYRWDFQRGHRSQKVCF